MDPVSLFLLMIAGLFLLGALGEIIFARTQIPDVIWLIGAGVILGPITGVVPKELLGTITPYFAALTLIIVLFDGGSKLVLKELVRAAPRATLLAILSFVLTVSAVAGISVAFGALGVLEDWSVLHGVMLGAIIGGSSSLIIMPSMALAKVEDEVANLVGLESALTDALCVVVTIAMIDVIVAGTASPSDTAIVLAKSFSIALAIGIAAGWAWVPVLRLLAGNQHGYPMSLAALILLYFVIDKAGGSAALGILAFAVVVGNAAAIMKTVGFSAGEKPLEIDWAVRTVHSQITFIVKSFFFTFIGLMLSPPWGYLVLGVFFGVVLLGARIPAAWLATRGAGFSRAQRKMINVSLPRGMAAGVLATLPFHRGVAGTEDLPPLVFAAVLTSILIFAIGFPLARSAGEGGRNVRVDEPPMPSGSQTEPAMEQQAIEAAATAQPVSHVPTAPQPAGAAPSPDGSPPPGWQAPQQPTDPTGDGNDRS